jgi:putative NIF3 family GTP cyclohydrolase 1 type 2
MKAIDLMNSLRDSSNYKPQITVDTIIIGDAEKEIRTVLTTWICSMDAVQAAIDGGFDAIITHEPTFYFHRDEQENLASIEDASIMKQTGLRKKKLIEDSKLVVIRIHDSWDIRPYYGMADTWARILGFGEPVAFASDGFQRRYDIEPIKLDDLAKRVASSTASLGEPLVQVIGDGGKIVSKVCFGPGYASTVQMGREMGCDVNIMCDDGSLFWMDIQCAVDMGYPIIRVNHGTSEEPGAAMIAKYINERLTGVQAIHFAHKPYYRMVGQP